MIFLRFFHHCKHLGVNAVKQRIYLYRQHLYAGFWLQLTELNTQQCWRFPCMFVLSYRAVPSSLSPHSPPLCSHFSLHCRGQGSASCVTESGHTSNTFKALLVLFCIEERLISCYVKLAIVMK